MKNGGIGKMKKAVTAIVVMTLFLCMSCMTVSAHGHCHGRGYSRARHNTVCGYHGAGCYYVDANGDGYCDYHGAGCH